LKLTDLLQELFTPNTNLAVLDDALNDLWKNTVKLVYPEGNPVPFRMDWSEFEDVFIASLLETGFYRYRQWVGRCPKRKLDKEEGESSEQARKKR